MHGILSCDMSKKKKTTFLHLPATQLFIHYTWLFRARARALSLPVFTMLVELLNMVLLPL